MGLDIMQSFDIEEKDENLDLFEFEESDAYYLSRTFCNFMNRRDAVEGEADLDQIGRLMQIDVLPLYKMLEYTPSFQMEELLAFDVEDDPEGYRKKVKEENDKLAGNLDDVLESVEKLILALEKAQDISGQINDNGFQSIPAEYYVDLDKNGHDNYLNNNLVQDLKNLLRLTKLAKAEGAKTTFFAFC